ncbi:hypothetical protein ABPG75_003462 [Micractinium tetrahymenae]
MAGTLVKRNTGSGEGAVTRRRSSGKAGREAADGHLEGRKRSMCGLGSRWECRPGPRLPPEPSPPPANGRCLPTVSARPPPETKLKQAHTATHWSMACGSLLPAAAGAARGKAGSSYFYTDDSAAIKLSPVRTGNCSGADVTARPLAA